MHKIKFLTQILKIIFQGTLDRPGCNHARLKKMQGSIDSQGRTPICKFSRILKSDWL